MNAYSIFFSLFVLSASLAWGKITSAELFGKKFPTLDHLATGEWWDADPEAIYKNHRGMKAPRSLKVDRDQVIAFALYTHD